MAFPDTPATTGRPLNWIWSVETVYSTCHKPMENN